LRVLDDKYRLFGIINPVDLILLVGVVAFALVVINVLFEPLKPVAEKKTEPMQAAIVLSKVRAFDVETLKAGDKISALREHEHALLARAMEKSRALSTIYAMRQELNVLWERSTESSEQLLARLQDWCQRAEASGIAPLAQFSLQLKRYA
jgi:stearoyl-CoA desaturase (delta-9 desaturase)